MTSLTQRRHSTCISGLISKMWMCTAILLCLVMVVPEGMPEGAPIEIADVTEGEALVLQCRFDPQRIPPDSAFYWRHGNGQLGDNVALFGVILEKSYRLDYEHSEGKYDLHIQASDYSRDNGQFQCSIREPETGEQLVLKTFQVTVLVAPGPPNVYPSQPVVVEGAEIELTCASQGGSPDPQIKWYRVGSDQPLEASLQPGGSRDKPTKAVFKLQATKDDDGEEFKCIVWNRALNEGKTLSVTTKLSVHYFPRVSVGPGDPVRVVEGTRARLECEVDAKPPVVGVRWLRHSRVLSRGFHHALDNVKISDAGEYVCQADNGLGQMGQGSLEVEVLHGPRVSVQERLEVREGETARLECTVVSNPRPIRVEWRKKSHGIGKEEEGSSSSSNFHVQGETLLLRHVEPRDAGFYVCTATVIMDPAPKTGTGMRMERQENATSQLVVRHGPGEAEIRTSPGMGIAGQPLTLLCSASPRGYPPPVFTWWKQDSPGTPLAMGPNLTLPILSLASEGVYQCRAQNALGASSAGSYNLEVFQAPKIVMPMAPQAVRSVGDLGFSINCSATGKPSPSVRWYRNGEEISVDSPLYEVRSHELLSRDPGNTLSTVSTVLSFQGPGRDRGGLLPNDSGRYSCRFSNDVDAAESTLQLRMQHAPIWEGGPKKQAGTVGETVNLECRVRAFPRPRFQWFRPRVQGRRQGKPDGTGAGGVEMEVEVEVEGSAGGKYESNSTSLGGDVHVGVLAIRDLVDEDFGPYICRTSNALGRGDTRIVVGPRGPPDPPLPPRAQATGPSWVLLSWLPGYHGGLPHSLGYMISVKELEDSRHEMMFDCQDKIPCNITGLRPQTSYTFKVKAFNLKGESDFSHHLDWRTGISYSHLPVPEDVYYGEEDELLIFTVRNAPIPLVGKVEIAMGSMEWKSYQEIPVDEEHMELKIESGKESGIPRIGGVQVRLCLAENLTLCGEVAPAQFVTTVPGQMVAERGFPIEYLVVIVLCCVAFVVAGIIILCCCCCRRTEPKATKGDKNYRLPNANGMHPIPNLVAQQPPPPPPYFQTDGKRDREHHSPPSGDDGMGNSPTHVYGTAQYGMNGGCHGYMAVGSTAGGSLNSQDSLWKPGPSGEDCASSYRNYDPLGLGFSGYGDYSHYPPSTHSGQPDLEFMPQHMHNKPPSASNAFPSLLDHNDSLYPIGESGYGGGGGGMPQSGLSSSMRTMMPMDESGEGEISTRNNRRIIREIVV